MAASFPFLIRIWALFHSSSATIRRWGTDIRVHSDSGLGSSRLRLVTGSITRLMRLNTRTPR